jgi:hypothetical protein
MAHSGGSIDERKLSLARKIGQFGKNKDKEGAVRWLKN